MVPSVRTRLLGTLGSNDAGATDRVDSIREFPGRMSGHWLFGWGWSQREFKDGAYAFIENFVSNAPLIAIHRGGIFVGAAFLAVVVIGCVIGYRLLRSNSLPSALYGGVFIGFSIVALNSRSPGGGHPADRVSVHHFPDIPGLCRSTPAGGQRAFGAGDTHRRGHPVGAGERRRPLAGQQRLDRAVRPAAPANTGCSTRTTGLPPRRRPPYPAATGGIRR